MKQIDVDAAYHEFLENDEQGAPERVTEGYREVKSALDRYIDALEEYGWKAGFSYALKLMKESGCRHD